LLTITSEIDTSLLPADRDRAVYAPALAIQMPTASIRRHPGGGECAQAGSFDCHGLERRARAGTSEAPMKVSIVRPHELGKAEITVWTAIQHQTPELASPFLSPGFAVAAGRVRDVARVAVMEDECQISGFFAFERHRGGIGKPIAAGVCDLQAVIRHPGMQLDARALLRGCGLASWEFDHLVAGQLHLANRKVTRRSSPIIDLSRGYDAYLEERRSSSTTVKKTVAQLRRLERDRGDLRFVFDAREPEAFETLLRWKSAQYRRTGRLNRVRVGWVERLLSDLFASRSADCAGTLSVLYAGDQMVAAHFGLRSESCLTWWFPAYDPSLAKYSPGRGLLLRSAEEASARGLRCVDLGKGEEAYKQALANSELTVGEGWIGTRSVAAALHGFRRTPQRFAYNLIMTRPPLHRAARGALRGVGRLRSSA
jgi:CelD/BcsL family acetyltransferase involved in cellulose biosynthesis